MAAKRQALDVIIVGAGFSGMYALHSLRKRGLSVRIIEAGDEVGGTWYWNRYPGARCDVDSIDYSYSFDSELQQEWNWSARYAEQPEILAYLTHVADRFDLRDDIEFETRVTAAHYDESAQRWLVRTDRGTEFSARYCIMATGPLSSAQLPNIPGIDSFAGDSYHTAEWPGEVDFTGKRVGLIGTGSTGIQVASAVAEQADRLFVFQRTANFSVPARDHALDDELQAEAKRTYPQRRADSRLSHAGFPADLPTGSAHDFDETTRNEIMERAWAKGGNAMQFTFSDIMSNPDTNAVVSEFVRGKIRELVDDPEVAESLAPKDHPFGTKRVCKDTGYYETFNRGNVTLVDLKKQQIVEMTETGVKTTADSYEVDAMIYATGFDALTGSLLRIDIQGRDGLRLSDVWREGPKTYLGVTVAGFPNLFLVAGPGSPSVLSNMVQAIEQHVDWVVRCIGDLDDAGVTAIEATPTAQSDWVDTVNAAAAGTLYMAASSWYLGANIPGKPRVFMPYVGGLGHYRRICDDVATSDYRGFTLAQGDADLAGAQR